MTNTGILFFFSPHFFVFLFSLASVLAGHPSHIFIISLPLPACVHASSRQEYTFAMLEGEEKNKLPPISPLWRRAKQAIASTLFLKKSSRETWRNVVLEDGAWNLPTHVCFWISRSMDKSDCRGIWAKRHVMLQSGRLFAVAGQGRKHQRVLADLRDVREILASSSVQATVDGAQEVLFPWTLTFDDGIHLRLASQIPRDRMLWTSSVQKLSCASLRGDDANLSIDFSRTDNTRNDICIDGYQHSAVMYPDGHFAGYRIRQ
jgi:hypothetical protein